MSTAALAEVQQPPESFRILIVEDDHAAANVLRTLLERVGYRVDVSTGGDEAVRLLEEGPPPDLLVLDWMLPDVSGLEICHRVRSRWDPLRLPILMVTARADIESISAAFDAGASDYLTKPFLGAELRARVAAHLRVRQMAEERRRMDEHLMEREKLSVLGLLVSSVAHDLNNPLGAITGYSQLLLDEEVDAERVDFLRRILGEVRRCNRIVSELLSFSRRHSPEREQVEVGRLLGDTLDLRSREIVRGGLDVSFQVPAGLPPVRGDRHQLQQVFLNILMNAEQALSRQGGSIRIRAALAAPGSRYEPAESWVATEISNDGPPIPAEVLPRIFDPFFTTKGKEEGTGLGLAICQRIVREHAGRMEVESDDSGTTFRVLLPASGEMQLPL